MRFVWGTLILCSVISGCSIDEKADSLKRFGSNSSAPTDPASSLKFADIEGVVHGSCAKSGCHDGVGMFALLTREDFSTRKPRPLNSILRGSMPKDDPEFRDSDGGKMLLEWLRGDQTE